MAEVLLPEKKFKKWQEFLLKLVGALVSLTIFALLFVGVSLLIEGEETTVALVLTAIGGTLFVIQMSVFVFVLVKQIKAEKAARASNEQQNDHE